MFRENTQMINDAISDFNEYQKMIQWTFGI